MTIHSFLLKLSSGAAFCAFSLAASLNATTITLGGTSTPNGGVVSSVVGVNTVDFDSPLPAGVTYSYVPPSSGDAPAIVTGNLAGVYASPAGDSSQYLSTGTGSVVINFADAIHYFGLYWGSIDSYNTIQFFTADSSTPESTFTGSDLLPTPDGITAEYVNFAAADGVEWNKIVLSSSSNAFETDNHAFGYAPTTSIITSSTPEPGAGMLAIAGGFFLLTGLAYRQRRTA